MNYRYIILYAGSSGFGSGFGDEFDSKFNYNTWFISNYLSLHIREMKIPTDGPYNMFYCNITKEEDSVKVMSTSSLNVKIHVEKEEIDKYLNLSVEKERFEYYLSLLERGYIEASKTRNIPISVFWSLHQDFRENGYKNERLFGKKILRNMGIKIELFHVLTSYSYNLILSVYDLQGNIIGKNSICKTLPDDIHFNKNVRHFVVNDESLVITDFLDKPQFVCSLKDLCKGIVRSKCVDKDTMNYIYNEHNAEKFERLKWEKSPRESKGQVIDPSNRELASD